MADGRVVPEARLTGALCCAGPRPLSPASSFPAAPAPSSPTTHALRPSLNTPVPPAAAAAWLSDAGADFRYSGKVMRPEPGGLTPLLAAVRDRLHERFGCHYDSVLINLYPDGKSGMRFHSDPLYDEWSADTAVVSVGCARTLVFRASNDFSRRVQFVVRSGDVTRMHGDCQERWQHSIKVEREAADATERVSLVYKKRLG